MKSKTRVQPLQKAVSQTHIILICFDSVTVDTAVLPLLTRYMDYAVKNKNNDEKYFINRLLILYQM